MLNESLVRRSLYLMPNEIKKLEIDLGVAHANQDVGNGICITVINKGTGAFSITLKFITGNTLVLSHTDLHNGYRIEAAFTNLFYTNEVQVGVTNPIFHIARIV